jgi:hypothetical protein
MTGSALAGGLFGLPLGAVTGFYMGDRWASNERTRAVHIQGQEREMGRLRRENRRLRRDEEMPEPEARLSRPQRAEPAPPSLRPGAGPQGAPEERPQNGATQARGSAQVRQAQKTLNEMGFQAGDVDGVLGPRTEAALKTFQHARGLEVTGRMNQETLAALQITTVSQRPRPGR